MLVFLLALTAGLITTVAGMGGGFLLVVGLAALWGPLEALTATGPALLIGNAHRLWMVREHLHREHALRYAGGALPGAVFGGWLAVGVPAGVLSTLMVGMALLAVVKHLGGLTLQPPGWVLLPGGALVGAVAATGGGGGTLAAPMMKGLGLSGSTYLATLATGSIAIHLGRMAGYSTGGWMQLETLGIGVGLAACIATGNAVGLRVRGLVGERVQEGVELLTIVACVGLALAA